VRTQAGFGGATKWMNEVTDAEHAQMSLRRDLRCEEETEGSGKRAPLVETIMTERPQVEQCTVSVRVRTDGDNETTSGTRSKSSAAA
jgi:hypothetical protein